MIPCWTPIAEAKCTFTEQNILSNYTPSTWNLTKGQYKWTLCALTTVKRLILVSWKNKNASPFYDWIEDFYKLTTYEQPADKRRLAMDKFNDTVVPRVNIHFRLQTLLVAFLASGEKSFAPGTGKWESTDTQGIVSEKSFILPSGVAEGASVIDSQNKHEFTAICAEHIFPSQFPPLSPPPQESCPIVMKFQCLSSENFLTLVTKMPPVLKDMKKKWFLKMMLHIHFPKRS